MSRDYKKKANGSGGSGRPMGVGILIGLLLGLGLALGVALYITKGPDPFVDKHQSAPTSPASTAFRKGAQQSKQEGTGANKSEEAQAGKESEDHQVAKLEFDFYKILPGWEQAVSDRDFSRKSKSSDKEVYYLQVAAFPDPAGADNLKARLALSGIESRIQTAELPDGKIWHRVRLGPFDNQNELNASRSALKELDLEANLIKVRPMGQ